MNNIMDGLFNGMAASEFYRSQVFPELFPHEPRMLIENWSKEDRLMYCGVDHTTSYGVSDGKSDLSTNRTRKEVNYG
jgi:hypothetical protein